MQRRMQRRLAVQLSRKAARDYLGCRVGSFLRKLRREDADAQMALYCAARDMEEDGALGFDFDIDALRELIEFIMEIIEMLMSLFGR